MPLMLTNDDVLFEESESLCNSNSNNKRDSSEKDCRPQHDQHKVNTALTSCYVFENSSFKCE
jgi:hypothetical protein